MNRYTVTVAAGTTRLLAEKKEVSNPAGSPNVTISQQYAHHQEVVNDIAGQLQNQGYTTSTGGF